MHGLFVQYLRFVYLYKIEQDYHYIHLQLIFLKHSPYYKVFTLSMSLQRTAIQISRSTLNPTTHMCWTCRLCWYCTCSQDMQTHTHHSVGTWTTSVSPRNVWSYMCHVKLATFYTQYTVLLSIVWVMGSNLNYWSRDIFMALGTRGNMSPTLYMCAFQN